MSGEAIERNELGEDKGWVLASLFGNVLASPLQQLFVMLVIHFVSCYNKKIVLICSGGDPDTVSN